MTRRGWVLSTCAWFLLCLVQAPLLTVADTKHDLTADPWGFLGQALSPWTDVFPLGQLQNQAYGYLFPQGLFFALLSPLPDWLTQRLWWGLLLSLAFAGTVKLLEALGTGSRLSRIVAAVLYALSPRILTTIGAISSEAWPVALVPWILLPVVAILNGPGRPSSRAVALAGCSSAVAVLCLGAVNAVATAAAVIPVLFWLCSSGCSRTRAQRVVALRLAGWWIPATVLACFWWIGPLLILGRYSPPFTDYIESAGITTHWFSLGEVLRGTTSWTPYLSGERQAGAALVSSPVFTAGTIVVALLGLSGLALRSRYLAHRGLWLGMLALGLVIFGVGASFSPLHEMVRGFLDGAGAPLRNLHKFDALVHLPLIVGLAHLLAPLRWPQRAQWAHPERFRPVVTVTAVGLLVAVVTAPAWSARLVPVDGFRSVPSYWKDAASWLNDEAHGAQNTRTMILPRASSARQDWGNTRDEPAQALLDVPWVVRDAVPLVPPEAIRGLDGVQREFDSGASSSTLAATLAQQGVGYLLVRSDLTSAADTPGSRSVLRTLERSPGFYDEASFGDGAVRIFRVGEADSAPRTIRLSDVDLVAGGAEVLPRLAAADAAGGGDVGAPVRDRLLVGDPRVPDLPGVPVTVTDTPALREHSYGTVTDPDSAIRAPSDPWRGMNPVHDYPSVGTVTEVRETGGRIVASSSADDPTALGGADTLSSVSAAVDSDPTTAWYPAPGSPVNQSLTVSLDNSVHQLRLSARAQGTPLRIQVTTYLAEKTVASSTVLVPVDEMKDFSLPPGDADRVELRIIGAWGRAGISEFRLTGADGTDVTPSREIVVPQPVGTPGRWVLGQEVAEGTMRRVVIVGADGVQVKVGTNDCSAPTSIDGRDVTCDQIVDLSAGEHEVRSSARRVDLVNMAIEGSKSSENGGNNETGGSSSNSSARAASDNSGTRIVVTTTAVNAGRRAQLRIGDEDYLLAPVTVNGWQQGWLVPASLSPAVAELSDHELASAVIVDFPATSTYRAWLGVGLAAAVILVLLWLWLRWTDRRASRAPRTPALDTPGLNTSALQKRQSEQKSVVSSGQTTPSSRTRAVTSTLAALIAWCALAWVLAGTAGLAATAIGVIALSLLPRVPLVAVTGIIAAVLFTRAPWGAGGIADGYAGDSLLIQCVFIVCLTAVFTPTATSWVRRRLSQWLSPRLSQWSSARRPAHRRETKRRTGSSTRA